MFLLIVGINVVFSAIDGGITASMSGQSFWKGFAAGAIGGLAQGMISQITLFNPMLSNYLGRIANTVVYGIFNEIFQNGSLKNMDWKMLSIDVALDSLFYMLYGAKVKSLSGEIVKTIVGGLIESGIDILETGSLYSPKAQEEIKKYSTSEFSLCEV